MDWNGTFRTFVSRPEPSVNFLYNYNYDQFQGMEMKLHNPTGVLAEAAQHGLVPNLGDKNISYNNINNQEKKKRLTSDQLDSLERSFQEEIKLDPDRKMKLSRDLGLQPRQIAVWFQNRRARWKAKQLERLYDALKQEYDVVFREKQKLQDEVMKLKGMLIREQAPTRNQVSAGYTEVSGEETVESTSIRSSNKLRAVANHHHPITECNYVFTADEFNPVSSSSPCWGLQLPAYP